MHTESQNIEAIDSEARARILWHLRAGSVNEKNPEASKWLSDQAEAFQASFHQ